MGGGWGGGGGGGVGGGGVYGVHLGVNTFSIVSQARYPALLGFLYETHLPFSGTHILSTRVSHCSLI